MEKQTQFNIWYVIIALIGIMWIRDFWVNAQQVEPVAYSEFLHHLKSGRIRKLPSPAMRSRARTGRHSQMDGRASSPRGWILISPRISSSTA
jgi:hypothetical protein